SHPVQSRVHLLGTRPRLACRGRRPAHYSPPAATGLSTDVQCAQRRAAMGISLRHSGHLLVVGSAGGSVRARAIKAFTGSTTKEYTAAAMSRNEMSALRNEP